MKFRLHLNTRTWEVCSPQAGSPSGWSAWGPLDRLEALRFIELGWQYEVV